FSVLHEQNARYENARIADDQSAWFEDQPAIEVARGTLDDLGVFVRMRRWLVVVAVWNAEPAAEIDVANGMAVATQRAHEIGEKLERVSERIEIGDLAAD